MQLTLIQADMEKFLYVHLLYFHIMMQSFGISEQHFILY